MEKDEIAEAVAKEMARGNDRVWRKAILLEAYDVLHFLGETELTAALTKASKRIGDKLKNL